MSDPAVRAYFKLMTDAAALLGAKDQAEARKELEEALQFETTLANVSFRNNYAAPRIIKMECLYGESAVGLVIGGTFEERKIINSQAGRQAGRQAVVSKTLSSGGSNDLNLDSESTADPMEPFHRLRRGVCLGALSIKRREPAYYYYSSAFIKLLKRQ